MNRFTDLVVEPTLWFLADWSVRWAVLIVVLIAWLVLIRPRRTATRYLVCWVVLLTGLAIPLLPRWGPGFSRTVAAEPAPIIIDVAPSIPVPITPSAITDPVIAAPKETSSVDLPAIAHVEKAPIAEPMSTRRIVCLSIATLWLVAMLWFVIRWTIGGLMLRRLRRAALPLAGASVEMLAECAAKLGLRRRVVLASHPRVRSPLTLGLWQPIILVPTDWPLLSPTVQRSSLLHELAHLARYDDWLALPMEMVRAVFWFHPLVRWLLARIERERELRCDETAVGYGIDPRQYAVVLLEFARQPGRLLPAPLAIPAFPLRFGRRRTVKARIEHLLEDNMQRWITPLSRGRAIVLALATLTLAGVIGCVRVQSEEGPRDAAETNTEPAAHVAASASPEFVPYQIQPFDVIRIKKHSEILEVIDPSGTFMVEPDGDLLLGPFYGRLKLAGLSIDEASAAVKRAATKIIDKPDISLSLVGRVKKWENDPSRTRPYFVRPRHILEIRGMGEVLDRLQLNGRYVVDPDGRIEIGEFYVKGGRFAVNGMTLQEANDAIQRLVDKVIQNQRICVTLGGWEEIWQKLEDEDEKPKPTAQALPKIPKEDLRYDGKTFDQWRRDLLTELKRAKRIDGIKAMAEFGANGYGEEAVAVIGEIVKSLDKSSLHERSPFSEAIKRIGPAATAPLIRYLKDSDPKLRHFAALSIRSIEPPVKSAIPGLIALLDDNDADIRAEAIHSAMVMDFDSPDVQKALMKAVTDPKETVRLSVVEHFDRNLPTAKKAVPVLIEALKRGDSNVQAHVIQHLERMGPDAKPAIPALLEFARNSKYADHAVIAITEIETDKGKRAIHLVDVIAADPGKMEDDRQPFNNASNRAFQELRKLGSSAAGAVPGLIKLLRSEDRNKQFIAITILTTIGPDAKNAIPDLQRLQKSDDENLSKWAGNALKAIAR